MNSLLLLLLFVVVALSSGATMTKKKIAEISTDSVAGKRLLSKARPLHATDEHHRALENNNYYSFLTKYSFKFVGCHAVPQFERDQGMRSQLLAKFKMCPSDNCNKCPNAGEYIVEMRSVVLYCTVVLLLPCCCCCCGASLLSPSCDIFSYTQRLCGSVPGCSRRTQRIRVPDSN